MPRVLDPGALDRELERVLGRKRCLVGRHHLATPFLKPVQLAQLPQPERSLDVGHVVLETGSEHLVGPVAPGLIARGGIAAQPVQAQGTGAREEVGIARQHPALGGGEVLGRVEAERDRVRARSDPAPAVRSGKRMGSVLEHEETVGVRQVPNGIHFRRVTRVVHRDDRLRMRRHRGGDPRRVDRERIRLDVNQHRPGAHVLDDVDGCGEGQRGRDHLVARTDAAHHERRVKRGGTRVEREGSSRRDHGGEFGLETGHLGSGRDPIGAQRIDHLGDFFFADQGRSKREVAVAPAGGHAAGGHEPEERAAVERV